MRVVHDDVSIFVDGRLSGQSVQFEPFRYHQGC